jgi:hypothetical protein
MLFKKKINNIILFISLNTIIINRDHKRLV